MKHLIATLSIATLSSCATIPEGYDGAEYVCMFEGQSCVDEYVRKVDRLRAMTPEQRLQWYYAERQQTAALRRIGQAGQPMVDALNQINRPPQEYKREPTTTNNFYLITPNGYGFGR